MPEDQRGPVLGTYAAEGSLYLLPLLRAKSSRFRIGSPPRGSDRNGISSPLYSISPRRDSLRRTLRQVFIR